MQGKKILNLLLVFIIGIYLWGYSFALPSFAVSTVNACMQKPSCAAAFISQSGTRSKLIGTTTNSVNNIVKFRRRSAIENLITQTSESNFSGFTKTLIGFIAGSTTYQITKLNTGDADGLRRSAHLNFCESNPDSNGCGLVVDIFRSARGISAYTIINDTTFTILITGNSKFYQYNVTRDLPPLTTLQLELSSDTTTLIGTSSDIPPWSELSEDLRSNIINNYLPDSEIIEKLESNIESSTTPLTSTETEFVEVSPQFKTDGSAISDLTDDWALFYPLIPSVDSPDTLPDTFPDTTPSDTPSDFPSDSPTDSPSDSPSDFIDNSSGGSSGGSSQDSSSDEDSSSDPLSLVLPDILEIAPADFESENFLKHAIQVFSNKFPFDIMGNLDVASFSQDCPSYTFFDRVFELCPIRDLIVLFKYPVIISFLIWSF